MASEASEASEGPADTHRRQAASASEAEDLMILMSIALPGKMFIHWE